jgi:hypothetical protein
MARILGIHGIAQQYRGGPQLTNQWWLAMRGGLEASGHREVADGLGENDVRVVFYGDLFRPAATTHGDGPKAGGVPPYTAAHLKSRLELDLLETWYKASMAQESAAAPGEVKKGRVDVAKHVMLKRLLESDALAGVTERAFIGDLKQVTAFLSNQDLKERVLARTAREVTADTNVIIGHSLGSIVAYEFLAARDAPQQVELLITVGSPLGMPKVFDRLTPAPVNGKGAWPGMLSRWVNIADKKDVVALRKELAPLFPPPDGVPGIEDRLVDNGKDAHAIEPHLTSSAAGQALGSVL